MKINLTKKEYVTLLEMIQVASWMINAHDEGPPKQPYDALEEKILSHAKDFGCGELVQFDQNLGAHFTTRAFEERVMPFIDEYDDDTFWTELTERLMERDMVRDLGEERYQALSGEERLVKERPYENKYDQEFAEHGLERLEVITGPMTAGHN